VAIVLGGNCPGWQLSRWQLSWVAIVPGGNCPGWQLSGWQLSRVAIVRVAIVRVAIVLGGNCPGGNCPPGGNSPRTGWGCFQCFSLSFLEMPIFRSLGIENEV
jgi:hypothetical protein